MPEPHVPHSEYVSHLRAALSEVIAEVHVHVFVMGPSPTEDSDAGRLRLALVAKCKEYGYAALMEHGEIIEAVRAEAGRLSDLAFVEEKHADGVHVLVFLPSSPGSFAELGFFAGLAKGRASNRRAQGTELIQKSIIVLDSAHVGPRTADGKLERGFVADGPAAMMEDLGAMVMIEPYDAVESIWEAIRRRIEAIRRFEA